MAITLGLRPHVTFEVSGDAKALAERIRTGTSVYPVTSTDSYLVVTIPEERQHYWSPQLQIELEDRGERVYVSGLISPMPAVWTLFAGIYTLILVMGFFGSIYGMALRQMGTPTPWIWSIPVSLGLLGCVYAAALIGQRMGRDQTRELMDFLHARINPSA